MEEIIGGGFILACVTGIVILIFAWFSWIVGVTEQESYIRCENFCATAGGWYTAEDRTAGLCSCARLSDHSPFFVDTQTGARYQRITQ